MNNIFFTVEDLKQFAYCPRIPYFRYVVPVPKHSTYKMKHGKMAEARIENLEKRRSLKRYGIENAKRHIHPFFSSITLGISGVADLLLETEENIFVVDYKFTHGLVNENVKLQLAAYSMLAEEALGKRSVAFFIYMIPSDEVVAFDMDGEYRQKVLLALDSLTQMIRGESIPSPVKERGKCIDCEYQNFCGDVF